MLKILGFIIGSAASIAAIVFLLGVPELHLSSFESDQARFDAAIEKIRERQQDLDTTQRETNDPAQIAVDDAAVDSGIERPVAQEAAAAATITGRPDDVHDEQSANQDNIQSADAGESAAQASQVNGEFFDVESASNLTLQDQSWHPLWTPFRSEIAARGFVGQLEKVTGLDYRIVKVKNGVYQVAFAYDDDTDMQNHLAQITAATGLELVDR